MSFFSQFPRINYDINNDGVKTELVDMFRHVDVRDPLIDSISTYTFYEINDGERPDIVSNRLYGTPDYYWTFFAANDFLKDGLNVWPKSSRQFEAMLEQDYADYSVLVFIPRQYPVARKYDSDFEMVNYFGGLELENENVRITAKKTPGASAKIVKFDDSRFQLWVHDIEMMNRFKNESEWKIEYIENPHENDNSQEWTKFQSDRKEWLKRALEWIKFNYTTVYRSFDESLTGTDFIVESDEYYEHFYTKFLNKLIFTSHHFYEKSYNAPDRFIDNEDDDQIITPFDAYSRVYSDSDINLPNKYVRGEVYFSADQRVDRFDRSELGEVSTNLAKTAKYVPGYVETYYTDKAKFLSYKETLDKVNFERRRIRVVRNSVISDFADRFRYILNTEGEG